MQVEVPECMPKVEVLKRKPDMLEAANRCYIELAVKSYLEDKIINLSLKERGDKKG